MVSAVKRDDALALLPPKYAEALCLRDAGHGKAEIASQLEIDVASVGALLYLAQAKLDHLLEQLEPGIDG